MKRASTLGLLAGMLLLGGCVVSDEEADGSAAVDTTQVQTQTSQPMPPMQPQPQGPRGDMEIEVVLSERELHVYRGGQRTATHPVAVGSSEWPTPTGEWTIGQVIFNPRWEPPNEEWAEDEEPAEPGAPDNPLGAAQLVYRAPNSIHGTDDVESLGKAVSHGSIRVSNDVAVELARQVMEAGGAPRDEAWIRNARQNNGVRQEVSIPNPVPIRVVERSTRSGSGAADSARAR